MRCSSVFRALEARARSLFLALVRSLCEADILALCIRARSAFRARKAVTLSCEARIGAALGISSDSAACCPPGYAAAYCCWCSAGSSSSCLPSCSTVVASVVTTFETVAT
ncbi:hypothetical protein PF005_g14300 [Phytophthora fragariae]|uniref:Uncharacterized protein n=1 Tax=Phytophthora fragariae TaxID=53985 RepID=A0A6A3RS26_9STRA|nr:hypothetical protein PF003_g6734 [Phytophthora fragariae]KAE8936775.1 hypothetical protein PF009_g13311 [Phytophthora fragariae]KAE8976896.1 hypothetical protein PF011_g23870 [Phytophthora fragariae]KAE9075126.1 hypothetical protein PF010_g24429 [Phytophthora fragariae]KAE9088939.1 hypothetical protein PF006_g25470 [Phytophthora fragariae]